MTAKMLTLLLLCAATLTQAASEAFVAEPKNDFPCPNALDISPCVCTQVDLKLNLDCSRVSDDAQLAEVFQANFPFNNFSMLTIFANPEEPRINILDLGLDIFQDVTFANIYISHTNLEYIYPTAFDKSAPRLETLIVTDSFLVLFPFDLVDYAPHLTDLRVFKNSLIHMSEMSSDTLTHLDVAYNPGLQYGDHALKNLPNLEYFVANNIELDHVGENAFFENTKLVYLDLSNNKLETLYAGSLKFKSPIETIYLNDNNIHTVEVGAIEGLGNGYETKLFMQNNFVESLDQKVWEPVFDSVAGKLRTFVFDGNPFECSCNILWLVSNDDHRSTIARGTICENTETDILDVDVEFLQANC
ncbi:oplophorus-luciferin 2-monooxygenase non-catalytic subunit-like [Eriocheir sinensis]|uniref:oplophorus-luciferin 2-monooxygenase non-catalytic subunit-like n=1 Tax=Eriocheir sinensis TaxID=95602 RepID=UPI0021CA6B69|nr:oplophorus-luciferin 2-monooxygenase non-catalytic subunit-like [Eriocheir sinensis]